MALAFSFKKRFQGAMLHSGRVYNFTYSAYQHDPAPLVIFLYWVSGTHPRTKHQWRFIQCINLNYISRSLRKQFVEDWVRSLYTTRNVKLTWDVVRARWPQITFATRRYLYSPSYYIKGLRTISLADVEKEVVGSLNRDFSTKTRIGFWSKVKKAQGTLSSIISRRGRRGR